MSELRKCPCEVGKEFVGIVDIDKVSKVILDQRVADDDPNYASAWECNRFLDAAVASLDAVGWKSPIDIMQTALEGEVIKAVQRVGIIVDREELLKALAYDRGQYEKGYKDGKKARDAEIVRCKDCKFYKSWGRVNTCWYWTGDPYEAASPEENDFCSYGERREDG